MGRAFDRDGRVPAAPGRSCADRVPADRLAERLADRLAEGACGESPRLSSDAAAAALGVPPEALRLGEVPPAPGEGAAAELVWRHAEAAEPPDVPASATRLLLLAAEGRPAPAPLCLAVEADRRVSAALVARARAAAGGDRWRPSGTVHSPVIQAVARLGAEEAAQLAAAWALRPLVTVPLAERSEEQAALWPELFRGALATARLAAALGGDARLDPERRGRLAGRAFAAGLLGVLGSAAALRSLAALRGEGALPRLGRRAGLRVVRAARVGLDAGLRRAWGLEPADSAGTGLAGGAVAAGAGWWQPERWLVRLAGAVDSLAQGPGAEPRAAADAFEAAGRLGLTPPALAVAVVRHRDAAAWADRLVAGA